MRSTRHIRGETWTRRWNLPFIKEETNIQNRGRKDASEWQEFYAVSCNLQMETRQAYIRIDLQIFHPSPACVKANCFCVLYWKSLSYSYFIKKVDYPLERHDIMGPLFKFSQPLAKGRDYSWPKIKEGIQGEYFNCFVVLNWEVSIASYINAKSEDRSETIEATNCMY